MAGCFASVETEGVQVVQAVASPVTRDDPHTFERLVAEFSATFVAIPAEAIDAKIEEAIARVAQFLGVDRSTVAQRSPDDRQLRVTHQWVRPGAPVAPMYDERSLPWLTAKLHRGEAVVVRSIDDLPPEAVEERAAMTRFARATIILPLTVAGRLVGAVSFASTRDERNWSTEIVDRIRLLADVVANGPRPNGGGIR